MAKKIRFPLKLSEGTEARTLEELREHFDLQAVLEYYKNGKLLTWLEDRYLEGESEAIQALDETAPDFQLQLCAVLQVEYTGDAIGLEEIERRQERLKKLRTITDDAEFIQNIDRVAFDQEELADLLDEDEDTIYLCGEKFIVPSSRKGITYIGIKAPVVHISGKVPEAPEKLGIKFVGVNCDNLPTISETEPETANCQEVSVVEDISVETLRILADCMVVTEHYALIRKNEYDERDGEDANILYIHSILSDEEVRLNEDAMNAILNEYNDFIVSGDELCCRNGKKYDGSNDCFIVDLASNKIIYSQSDLDGENIAAFNSEFLILYHDDYTSRIVEIVDRYFPQKRKALSNDDDCNLYVIFYSNGNTQFVRRHCGINDVLGLSDKKLFLNVFLEVGDDARDHLAYIDLQDNSFHILMEINLDPLTKFIGNSKYIFLEDSRNLQMVNLVDQTLKQIATNVGKLVVHEGDFMVAEGNTASYIVYANAAVTDRIPGFRRGRAPTNFLRTMGMNAPQDLFAIDMSSGKIKEIPFFLEPQLRCIFHVFGTTLYCCNMDIDEGEPGERIGYKFDLTEDSPQPVKFEL